MTAFNSFDEILVFAIQREQEAQDFYTDMARSTEHAHMRQIFEAFAKEEGGHKAKLQAIKEGKHSVPSSMKIPDLKVADYHEKMTPSSDMSYDEILLLAMQREKAAFKLYSDLAEAAEEETTRSLFLALAQEEAKHKLRFELEYDREFLNEN